MPQVTIHRREPGVNTGPDFAEVKGVHVTYSTPDIPPRNVFVPGELPTEAQVAAAIRQDIQAAASQRPTTMTI